MTKTYKNDLDSTMTYYKTKLINETSNPSVLNHKMKTIWEQPYVTHTTQRETLTEEKKEKTGNYVN